MSPTIILGILLALSVAGNAWQYRQALEAATRYGTTKQLAEDTKAAAATCTKGVEDLDKAAKERDRRLQAALKAIQPALDNGQREVMAALKARPDDPKDLCGSLERYFRAQVKAERGAK